MMSDKQRTIQNPVSISGQGLHTGEQSTITFLPAPVNYGYRFVRTDLPENVEIPALVENVVDLSRGTTLGIGDVRVHTVEHVLAALVGLRIDNCRIELSGIEPPVGDGSSMPFVEELLKAGFVNQEEDRKYFIVEDTISYHNESKQVDYVALPTNDYRITVMVDYNNPALGSQHSGLFNLEKEFVTEFAPARTFCFLSELQQLLELGLIKGGSLNSAFVIVDKDLSDDELHDIRKKFNIDTHFELGTTGILNDVAPRFKNEPARHKLLDMLGDLALVGIPIKAQILAARPGHANNIEFAKKIRELYLKKEKLSKYQSKPGSAVVLNINDLLKIMPHRYPFLLIDRLIEYNPEENYVIGLKNVTVNEPFFPGHFPENPIMPGVLQIEALAQTSCLLIIQLLPNYKEKLIVFTGIKNARFRRPVVPGDQLIMKVSILASKFNTFQLKGTIEVDGQLIAEAEFSTATVDKEK